MSTPDKTTPGVSDTPGNNGVNAFKLSRTKLVLSEPVAPSGPSQAGSEEAGRGAVASRRRRVAFAVAALAVLAIAGLVMVLNWQPAASRAQAPEVGATSGAARPSTSAALPNYRALVIGINQYEQAGGSGWPTLRSARADAEAISKVLSDDYGFHVQTLLDGEATRSAILNALDEFATSGEDSADLIYFAGHGYFDDKLQEGYWIPADARKSVDGRQAKEDWLWNSTITRLIGASRARHVLVMSDACYGGSLFRGDEPLGARSGKAWYERAIAKPSRYLITSGGLEPVLDSGAGHSVFAQEVINYLKHSDQNIFSANDLGLALRARVADLTRQMVQMGPLPVSGYSGGEFVFVRQKDGVRLAALAPQVEKGSGLERGSGEAPADPAQARRDTIRDAVALTQAGAPKAANNLVSALLQQNAQDAVARAVADYIARSARQEGRDELRKLIEQVEAKGKAAAAAEPAGGATTPVRPRILACLGPVLPSGGNTAGESAALLYRIVLRSELEGRAGLKVIERETLEKVLQEQSIGVSDLADPRARLAIGKLLPASLLLLGDLLPAEKGDKIYLRLVDTETTQVLASFSATRAPEEDQEKLCAELAAKIIERVTALKPLLAPVSSVEDSRLKAGLGSYHGVREGQVFNVLSRTPRDRKTADDFVEKEWGTATVRGLSDFSCELDVVWGAEKPARAQDLWIRERSEKAVAQK